MYIFTYMRTEFTCVGIYLRIYTQGLYVYVYILRIHTQSSHVRVCIIVHIHIEFTYVCVYLTCIHMEFTRVCVHGSVYSHRVGHKIYMCMCIWLRTYTESLHVGV